ncbi:hypothetical protein KIN20_005081 [Parelaphostrongylus tenuis]|uniref:Uncharacterized protein n=1 Tax=Parelaphostrongylus tenuis TaxID=148309 RepID=A0AAD5MKP2_PARTN|nr:hypothetical protein KIN20_005081 [Parelaphostrongylus tenuis]
MTFKQLHKSHRIVSLFLIISFTHSALSSADTATRSKTGNGFKLNLKAWMGGPSHAVTTRHSFSKRFKPPIHRLRVKAVKEDRHIIYIEKTLH